MIVTAMQIKDSLTELPAFPRIVLLLLETLSNEQANIRALLDHLKQDPSLTSKVLATANASANRPDTDPIMDARVALEVLGARRVRELVLTATLVEFIGLFGQEPGVQKHALAAGACAQELARFCNVNAEYALVSGLLHDIGQIWMSRCHARALDKVRALMPPDMQPTCGIERAVFGMCHCEIGHRIASLWGLPAMLCDAIGQHHHPEWHGIPTLVTLTHAAETICHGLVQRSRDDSVLSTLEAAAGNMITLDWENDLLICSPVSMPARAMRSGPGNEPGSLWYLMAAMPCPHGPAGLGRDTGAWQAAV
jgi:putative nucleotidyltransferase with HDIG domain